MQSEFNLSEVSEIGEALQAAGVDIEVDEGDDQSAIGDGLNKQRTEAKSLKSGGGLSRPRSR